MIPAKSTINELDMGELEDVLRRAAERLDEKDYGLIKAVIESYAYLTELVGDKDTTIRRLRQMLFGEKTEKTSAVVSGLKDAEGVPVSAEAKDGPELPAATDAETIATVEGEAPAEAEPDSPASGEKKGHGRNGADDFTGAEKIEVRHESLQPGNPCPKCETGTLYDTGRPGVLVRLVGQAPVKATVYFLQKLRCNPCGAIFTAKAPEGVHADERYDPTVASMLALLRYGYGMPFHRQETLQGNLGIPLPDATQWDIVDAQAERAEPVWRELVRQAAQGEVVHNDDTGVKILELMAERSRQAALEDSDAGTAAQPGSASENSAAAPADDSADDSAKEPGPDRTGMFTTAIVATPPAGGHPGHKIALFLSGRQHAGENLKDVLLQRAAERPPPIQMSDALSRNLPGKLKTIVANCLAHGRRQFVDEADRFPEECQHVLEMLAVVYHNDAIAREQKLTSDQRLLFHQAESGPIMEELHVWLVQQFDERRVEPNSGLGKAIAYLLRHWEKLTLFLRVAGAPLDNNVCERALKKAIRHRRNSLFYKTPHGAHVGDMFMSLIATCELCGANPFDYLTELDRHAHEAGSNPTAWMPWNYRETLEGRTDVQTPCEASRQDDGCCPQAAQSVGQTDEGPTH